MARAIEYAQMSVRDGFGELIDSADYNLDSPCAAAATPVSSRL